MQKPTRAQMKQQMERVNKLSIKFRIEIQRLYSMSEAYYGEETYSDHDLDEIIDCLDYGVDTISFERFDSLMKEINGEMGRNK